MSLQIAELLPVDSSGFFFLLISRGAETGRRSYAIKTLIVFRAIAVSPK